MTIARLVAAGDGPVARAEIVIGGVAAAFLPASSSVLGASARHAGASAREDSRPAEGATRRRGATLLLPVKAVLRRRKRLILSKPRPLMSAATWRKCRGKPKPRPGVRREGRRASRMPINSPELRTLKVWPRRRPIRKPPRTANTSVHVPRSRHPAGPPSACVMRPRITCATRKQLSRLPRPSPPDRVEPTGETPFQVGRQAGRALRLGFVGEAAVGAGLEAGRGLAEAVGGEEAVEVATGTLPSEPEPSSRPASARSGRPGPGRGWSPMCIS